MTPRQRIESKKSTMPVMFKGFILLAVEDKCKVKELYHSDEIKSLLRYKQRNKIACDCIIRDCQHERLIPV